MKRLARFSVIIFVLVVLASVAVFAKPPEEKNDKLYDFIIALEGRIDELETELEAKDAELEAMIVALEAKDIALEAKDTEQDGRLAALESAGIYSRTPDAWLGSTMTGRWLFCLITATAEMSSVLRVAFSNVRMPRSQRMT